MALWWASGQRARGSRVQCMRAAAQDMYLYESLTDVPRCFDLKLSRLEDGLTTGRGVPCALRAAGKRPRSQLAHNAPYEPIEFCVQSLWVFNPCVYRSSAPAASSMPLSASGYSYSIAGYLQ